MLLLQEKQVTAVLMEVAGTQADSSAALESEGKEVVDSMAAAAPTMTALSSSGQCYCWAPLAQAAAPQH